MMNSFDPKHVTFQVPNIEALEKKMIQLNEAMPKEVQQPEDVLKRLTSLFKEGAHLELSTFRH